MEIEKTKTFKVTVNLGIVKFEFKRVKKEREPEPRKGEKSQKLR